MKKLFRPTRQSSLESGTPSLNVKEYNKKYKFLLSDISEASSQRPNESAHKIRMRMQQCCYCSTIPQLG